MSPSPTTAAGSWTRLRSRTRCCSSRRRRSPLKAFLDTTPQEMISYFLAQAGLSKMKLSATGYPERKRLPIRQMNVIEAINAVHAAWNIKQPFFFSGGVFYWGEKPEQEKTYIFEYGVRVGPVCPALPQNQRKTSQSERGVRGREGGLGHQRRRLHPHEDLFLRTKKGGRGSA